MEKTLRGVFAALTTPFIGDEIAAGKFRENLLRYEHGRLQGYVILGSTGEAVFLSDAESEKLVETAREAARAEKKIIVGTSRESAKVTIAFTNRMAGLGANAALIKPSYYYKSRMSQEAVKRFYFAIADQAKIPVIIYNIPQNTMIAVEPHLIIELSKHPNIAGIKDSSGNLATLMEVIPHLSEHFSFLLGAGSILLPGLMMGASGAILAMASVIPKLCVKLYELYEEGQMEEARKLQLDLVPLNKALTKTLGIPAIKYALDLLGYYGGPPRLPLFPLDENGKAEILALLEKLGLIKLDS